MSGELMTVTWHLPRKTVWRWPLLHHQGQPKEVRSMHKNGIRVKPDPLYVGGGADNPDYEWRALASQQVNSQHRNNKHTLHSRSHHWSFSMSRQMAPVTELMLGCHIRVRNLTWCGVKYKHIESTRALLHLTKISRKHKPPQKGLCTCNQLSLQGLPWGHLSRL